MNLKGDYNPETQYDVGDVVRFDNMAFVLKEGTSAGTPPNVNKSWARLEQTLWDVVDLILDTASLNISDDAIVLKGTTDPDAEYLITVDDSGLTPELAVDLIEEEE